MAGLVRGPKEQPAGRAQWRSARLFQANFLGKITINGSGDQHRSFIHVDKVANAIARIIDSSIMPGVYNLVEHNLSINEIASEIHDLYPKLDIIHANYNIRMKDVLTFTPCSIWSQISLPVRTFNAELADFVDHFSF